MVATHDKSAFLHQRPRRFHPDTGCERPVGPEIAARPCRRWTIGVRDRAASRRRRFRAGAADGGHVPAAEFRSRRGHYAADPRRPAHPGGRSRVLQRRGQHGARLLPVAAQDRKSARSGVVAAELGGAGARRHSRADRSEARHERQMDHAPDRRRDGHRRAAAAMDERSARPRRGHAADAVRACRGGGGFRQPVRQCRRSAASATSTATSRCICIGCR